MADLQDLDTVSNSEAGAVLELDHPDGTPLCDNEGKRMWIKLLGPDSKIGMRHKNAKAMKIVSKMAVRKMREDSAGKESADELEDQEDGIFVADMMADLATDWYLVWGGKPVEFSRENSKRLMATFPWITEQCDAFCARRTNYLGNSSAP